MDSLKASLSAPTSSRKKVNSKLNEDHWGSDSSGMKVWVTPKNLYLPRDWLRIKGTKMYSETRSWIQQLQLEYQLQKWGASACIFFLAPSLSLSLSLYIYIYTHTHTHTHAYIYICICIISSSPFSPGQFHIRLNISLCVPNGSHGILTELEEKLASPRDGNRNC